MSTPAPRLRVVTERRRRPLIAGAMGIVLGLGLTLAGAAVLWTKQTLAVATADGRAMVSDPITFEAESDEYGLILLPLVGGDNDFDAPVERLVCTVVHPVGSTESVDSTSQNTRLDSSAGTEIGSFRGRGGTTTVTCAWKDGRTLLGYFYSVGKAHETAKLVGNVLLIAGVALICLAVVPLIIGIRGRAVTVRTPA